MRLRGVAAIKLGDRLAELGAGLLRLALLPIGPALEAGHAGDDQTGHANA